MTMRRILLGLVPNAFAIAVVVMLAGCASSDGTSGAPEEEEAPITEEEVATGEAWTGGDGVEESSESVGEEAAQPYLDEGLAASTDTEATDDDIEPLSPEDIAETQSCTKMTGYRYGKAFSICVVWVNGKRVEVNTARAYLRMRRNAKSKGVYLYINSGFRTMAEQRYLYNCYKTKTCNGGNLAAPPGYSNHQSGHALDLNTSASGVYWYLSHWGKNYGFRRTVASERWHWEKW
jgi:hypothetical protein